MSAALNLAKGWERICSPYKMILQGCQGEFSFMKQHARSSTGAFTLRYRRLCFALLLNEPCFPPVWPFPLGFCVFARVFLSLPLLPPPGYTFGFPAGLLGDSLSPSPSCSCLQPAAVSSEHAAHPGVNMTKGHGIVAATRQAPFCSTGCSEYPQIQGWGSLWQSGENRDSPTAGTESR